MLFQDSTTRLTDITDGTSNTLLLGERPPSADFQFDWWYAGAGQRLTGSADLVRSRAEPASHLQWLGVRAGALPISRRERLRRSCGMFHFYSPHSGGANFVRSDGSVRFLPYPADSAMPALASRAGGEVVSVE